MSQAGSTALLPCVYTFSKDYDTSDPYFPATNESPSVRLDSTFQPDPPDGWFGLGNLSAIDPPLMALDYFQTAPWFHLAFDKGVDKNALGGRDKAALVPNPFGAITSLGVGKNGTNATISPTLTSVINSAIDNILSNARDQTGWEGILANFPPMLFFNISVNRTTYIAFLNTSINSTLQSGISLSNLSATGFNLTGLQPLPYFTDTSVFADSDLDDLISNDIQTTIYQLALANASTVRLSYFPTTLYRYPAVASAIQVLSNMPWGNLRFSAIENGSYSYMIQFGTDTRLSSVASFPREGLRQIAFQTMFSRAICVSIQN